MLFLPQLLVDVNDSLGRVKLFPDLVSTFQASSRRNKNKRRVMYRDSALSPSPPKDPQNRYSALNLFAFSEQFTSTARHFETYLGGLSFETVAEAA